MSSERNSKTESRLISRRSFVKGTALSTAAFMVVPRHVLGGPGYTSPSDKLNIAGVGVGGMGKNNIKACADENIVSLCDIDDAYAAPVYETYPKAKKYYDFRKMLEEQKDIDAVIIATPDHTHAVIALTAMRAASLLFRA